MNVNPTANKPTVLIIESFPQPDAEELKPYVDWLAPHFEINSVYITDLDPANISQDSIVVTGSKRQIAKDPIPEALTKLYQETTKPLLAVCWGHQALAAAWGAKVVKKREFIERSETINESKNDALLDNLGLFFSAYESHYEHVVRNPRLNRNFEVVAHSASCGVEVIRHKTRLLWGVQFHPERSGKTGLLIAANFSRIVKRITAGS